MEPKDYERLAKLETQIENLTQLVVELKAQLLSYTQNFPTRVEVDEKFRNRDENIQEIREEIKVIKAEQQNDKRASAAQIVAWAGVIVSLLVAYFK